MKYIITSRKRRHLWLFFLSLTLVTINETLGYTLFGMIISFLELIVLAILLTLNRMYIAFISYSLFLLSSLEFPANLSSQSNIYTFRSTELFGISLSTWSLLLMFFLSYIKKPFLILPSNRRVIIISALLVSSILIGVFGILLSDYNPNYFVRDIQYILSVFLYVCLFRFLTNLLGNEWFIFDDLKRIILYVIIGRSLITFIGYLSFYIFGNTSILKGYYGGVKIFTFDPLDYFAAFIILALFSDKGISRSQKILILISWIISIFSFVIFQPFGKSILFLFITLIELIVILLLKQRLLISKILILTVTFISIIAIVYFLDYLSTTNILLSSKYSEVKKFLSFKWIKDPYLLPSSPRDRVLEFYNIIWSHIENPFFLLIGRGIGGYFKDEKFYNYTASEIGGYSLYEVKTRQFYNPHESLNFILLKFGLAGVTFYLFILYKIIKATKRDIFTMNLLLAGFGLFFGYSLKLSILVGWSLYIFLFSTKKYSSDKLFLLQERRLIE